MTAIRKRMLKAIKGKFTPLEAEARIMDFLEEIRFCPWTDDNFDQDCESYGGAICKAMFPKLREVGTYVNCPCNTYKVKHVKKRAKEALK